MKSNELKVLKDEARELFEEAKIEVAMYKATFSIYPNYAYEISSEIVESVKVLTFKADIVDGAIIIASSPEKFKVRIKDALGNMICVVNARC